MTENVIRLLEKNGFVNQDNKMAIAFGIKKLYTNAIDFLVVILVGIALQMLVPAIIFQLSYLPLRIFAGGVHAGTKQRCFVYSWTLTIVSLLLIKYLDFPFIFVGLMLLVCGFATFLFSPVEDRNKPLSKMERRIFGRNAKVIFLIYTAIILLGYFIDAEWLFKPVLITICAAVICLAVGVLKNGGRMTASR